MTDTDMDIYGRIVGVYMDLGCIVFQVRDTLSVDTYEFEEFEKLGLTPAEEWKNRLCKLVCDKKTKAVVGAIIFQEDKRE